MREKILEILIKYDKGNYYIIDLDYEKIAFEIVNLKKSAAEKILEILFFILKIIVLLIFFAIFTYVIIGTYNLFI